MIVVVALGCLVSVEVKNMNKIDYVEDYDINKDDGLTDEELEKLPKIPLIELPLYE